MFCNLPVRATIHIIAALACGLGGIYAPSAFGQHVDIATKPSRPAVPERHGPIPEARNFAVCEDASKLDVRTRSAFEAYFLHIASYPSGPVSWGEDQREAQGITNDGSHWYITATDRSGLIDQNIDNAFLWKIPVETDLNLSVDSDPNVTAVNLYQLPDLWNKNDPLTGYIHWGDLDHYQHNGRDYLVMPVTSPQLHPSPAIIVFRAEDLSLVGIGGITGGPGHVQRDVGWCALDPCTGYLYSSNDGPTSELLVYELPWDDFPDAGYGGEFTVTYKEFQRLTEEDGHTLLDLHNMQGGEFTPTGGILYLSSGGGRCHGHGVPDPGQPTDGINVIDTRSWRRIEHSTNRCYGGPGNSDCDHPQSDYFDLTYDFGCGVFETHADQPQGVTVWDLDDGRAPQISGQLHVLTASVGLVGNMATLEHFGAKLYVDGANGNAPPAWTIPLFGTRETPFKFVSDAVDWYPAWHGAELAIVSAGSTQPSIVTLEDVLVYEIGAVPNSLEQGGAFPNLNLLLYNFSSPPVDGSLPIELFLSPDPVMPGRPATDDDISLSVVHVSAQLRRKEFQWVVGSGVRVPCEIPPSNYYLGTSVSGGPASSPTIPIAIDIAADTTRPVVHCPNDVTVECEVIGGTPGDDSQLKPFFSGVSAQDDCGVTITNDSPSLFPLGETTVAFTAEDDHGNRRACAATITVEDTVPPAVSCPEPIEVEFNDADGAVVHFVTSATDGCAGSVGTISSPAPGASFPIGTTQVTVTATDPSGNLGSCSFPINVLGPLGVTQNVLEDLSVLRRTISDSHDQRKLDEAIRKLNESLAPDLWIDQTHLQQRHGNGVFNKVKEAVKKLDELTRNSRSPIAPAILQGFIDRLVRSERELAFVAIQDSMNSNHDQHKLEQAIERLADGDREAGRGKADKAIDRYREAWKKALESARHSGDNSGHDSE